MKDYTEYRTRFIRGNTYIILIAAGTISVPAALLIVVAPSINTILIMLPFVSFLPLMILFLKSQKVRIGNDYIESRNLFRTKRMDFSEVRKFGIFISSRYKGSRLTSFRQASETENTELLNHYIYLTTSDEFDLKDFKPKKHIRFSYQKPIYLHIMKVMEALNE